MMPLCTTTTSPALCGWALVSDGRPWVAQRVWPMPTVPRHRLAVQHRFEIAQLALAAANRHLAVVQDGDPGGVVTAIFELS